MSNQQALYLEWHTLDQAGASIRASFLPYVEKNLRDGLCLAVKVEELEDARSMRQRRFYWGVVLKEISEQARIGGQQYVPDAWHELFKRLYLPRKVAKSCVAGKARQVVSVTLGSTKGLGVKKMGIYLDKVQAAAAADYGVAFSAMDWNQQL
jgi:hypothetical protein